MSAGELELHKARFIVRSLRMEDFESWSAMRANSEAAHFIGGLPLRAVAWRAS
jgi:hypothetical protein